MDMLKVKRGCVSATVVSIVIVRQDCLVTKMEYSELR
jgi:phage pi2 protein 07